MVSAVTTATTALTTHRFLSLSTRAPLLTMLLVCSPGFCKAASHVQTAHVTGKLLVSACSVQPRVQSTSVWTQLWFAMLSSSSAPSPFPPTPSSKLFSDPNFLFWNNSGLNESSQSAWVSRVLHRSSSALTLHHAWRGSHYSHYCYFFLSCLNNRNLNCVFPINKNFLWYNHSVIRKHILVRCCIFKCNLQSLLKININKDLKININKVY